MKKAKKLVVILIFTLIMSTVFWSCKKEITEVTEVTQVITDNTELFSWAQPEDEMFFIDIDQENGLYELEDRLVEIPIGALKVGDRVIAETTVRISKNQNGANCSSKIGVTTGPLLSSIENELPGKFGNPSTATIPFDNGSLHYGENLYENEDNKFFQRKLIVEITENYTNVYASFWVNTFSESCADENAVRGQLGVCTITVERD